MARPASRSTSSPIGTIRTACRTRSAIETCCERWKARCCRSTSKRDVRSLLEKFQPLSHDGEFWNHRTDGLAMLAAPDMFEVFELQRPVQENLIVADTFYLKPLLRISQSADRFQVLCLTRDRALLYEGNRDALDPVELIDTPATLTEALGTDLHAAASVGALGRPARRPSITASGRRRKRWIGIATGSSVPSIAA